MLNQKTVVAFKVLSTCQPMTDGIYGACVRVDPAETADTRVQQGCWCESIRVTATVTTCLTSPLLHVTHASQRRCTCLLHMRNDTWLRLGAKQCHPGPAA